MVSNSNILIRMPYLMLIQAKMELIPVLVLLQSSDPIQCLLKLLFCKMDPSIKHDSLLLEASLDTERSFIDRGSRNIIRGSELCIGMLFSVNIPVLMKKHFKIRLCVLICLQDMRKFIFHMESILNVKRTIISFRAYQPRNRCFNLPDSLPCYSKLITNLLQSVAAAAGDGSFVSAIISWKVSCSPSFNKSSKCIGSS